MPLLTSNYIASWYIVKLNNKYRLLQSWNESINQDVTNKPMVQGDIGNHIMDIGGIWNSASIDSPVIIMGQANTGLYDAFDIVLEGLSIAQNPVTDTIANNLDYVLMDSTIRVDAEAINVTANIENALGWVGKKEYFGNSYTDFTGRTAKFYDTIFNFMGGSYLIKSGQFDIKVDTDKIYFIGQSQSPTYAIKGYSVSGQVNIVTTPSSYDGQVLLNFQTPGKSNPLASEISFTVIDQNAYNGQGYRKLNLGEYIEVPTVSLDLKPSQVIEATVKFNTYFRRSSYIG